MIYTTRQVQLALNKHGYKLAVDNEMGPNTEAAISDFKGRHGLLRRPLIGPLTEKLLFGKSKPSAKPGDAKYPPWLNELGRHIGLHEVRNNAELRKWLKSDGKTLGDPAKLPWCADAMQTAIRLTLPNEPFPGNLGKNPYWARNWALLGVKSSLRLGAMVVLTRKGGGGHIGTAVGYDPVRRRIRLRGGNQSNLIKDAWVDERRVIGYRKSGGAMTGLRKPKTWKHELPPIPIMNSAGQVISTNEA